MANRRYLVEWHNLSDGGAVTVDAASSLQAHQIVRDAVRPHSQARVLGVFVDGKCKRGIYNRHKSRGLYNEKDGGPCILVSLKPTRDMKRGQEYEGPHPECATCVHGECPGCIYSKEVFDDTLHDHC